MGCTGSKSSAAASVENFPQTKSLPEPQQIVVSGDRDNSSLCSSSVASNAERNKKIHGLLLGKSDSNRSLNSRNEIDDIHVTIPDPFRSQYKVVHELQQVNSYLTIKRGVSRDRKDVRIESTDVAAYNLSGGSDIAYFERLDVLRRLDHETIPAVLDFYDSAGLYRIVMEYASGKDFASLLQGKGAMAPHNTIAFARSLTLAVEHLHSQRVAHRSIEPKNIILTTFNNFSSPTHMKLVGLDRPILIEDEARVRIRGLPASEVTPYSAPELVQDAHDLNVDLYSLGATIYSAVTGKIPPNRTIAIPPDAPQCTESVWEENALAECGLKDIVLSLMSLEAGQRISVADVKAKLFTMK